MANDYVNTYCRNAKCELIHLQLDYYTLATPSHWLTISDVKQEVYTLTKLPPLTTIQVISYIKCNYDKMDY